MEIELRTDSVHISGYVNAVGRDSRPIINSTGEKFVEMVEPGSFARSLKKRSNVELRINHNRIIANTQDGSLKLHEDTIGLRAEADITDPVAIAKARAGKFRGWSFGMYTNKDSSTMEQRANDIPRRHLHTFDMYEVTLVDDETLPCYAGTSVEYRSDGEFVTEIRSSENEEITVTYTAPPDLSEYEQRACDAALRPFEMKVAELSEYGWKTELRWDESLHPRDIKGRFKNKSYKTKVYLGGKGIDKSAESGIIKSSDDIEYISAKGPNEFKKGFDKNNLIAHWYGGENAHSHKDEYPYFTMEQYADRALNLIQQPTSQNILGYKTSNGTIVRYDRIQKDFVKGHPFKGIATMFKTKEEYYYNQYKKEAEE